VLDYNSEIQKEIEKEIERAETIYGRFASGHEFIAVLQEEIDELWANIRAVGYPSLDELVQVAAIATRALRQYAEGGPGKFEDERRGLFDE
jgi:hypothetical protein|tara:strand:- start:58 stop:330 length:273 start_codon:yes stop_codon:yes gene_type:complete